jgi:dihydroorotate dehydrogenase
MAFKSNIFSLFYKIFGKPIFFLLDPEFVHDKFTDTGRILGKYKITKTIINKLFKYTNQLLKQDLFGINFSNPVGLSAGFDYNGKLNNILPDVGFGFESIGTVTYSPYEGNPKPRLGRIPKQRGLIVNKGFKSDGIDKVLNENYKHNDEDNFVVGISIGATNSKQCSTAPAQIDDICRSVEYLKSHTSYTKFSYIEINISCPNVLGSGSLANPETLESLLSKIRQIGIDKPLFVKFQLEIEWDLAQELIEIMIKYEVDAIIVANLLKHRENISMTNAERLELENKKGNISGKPTWDLSNELISKVYKEFGDKIKIIGVGGVFSAEDAYEKIRRGASLVQLITGMIYNGPQLIGQINEGLVRLMKRDGYKNISEAVGSMHK